MKSILLHRKNTCFVKRQVPTKYAIPLLANLREMGYYYSIIGSGVQMKKLTIETERKSELLFSDSIDEIIQTIASAVSPHRIFIVTDTIVAPLFLNEIQARFESCSARCESVVLPDGEASKSPDGLAVIYHFLAEHSASRKAYILNLGGGMVSDLGGFAAATYMRGISYINIPTTLLGMVDSSIGGKTAINFDGIKNLIGVFHSPAITAICPKFLSTLPESELRSGMGEIIKYHMISDGVHSLPGSNASMTELIENCCRIKKHYVELDEFDLGQRKILNFGHTFGHAFESGSGFTLSHGEAVGLGMLAVCRFGEQKGLTKAGASDAVLAALSQAGLPTDYHAYAGAAVCELEHDKKGDGASIDMVFVKEIGKPLIMRIAVDEAKEFLLNV